MKAFLLAALALALATPAFALSCMRPDAVQLYEMARDSDDTYLAVRGRIDLSEPAQAPKPETEIPAITKAVMSGYALTQHGFGALFNRKIEIRASCLGPWCGSAETFKREQIAMLRVDDNGVYTLMAGPCGGTAMDWTKDGERRLLDCHRTGNCVLAE
ncbi:MAG: hypothetical protein KJO30_04200 [Boseongicola sp.]|nr:hypothetical protein [Boseongicola sp.]NNJ66516.1 hypothetical protein [Boseongicola sp.]